VTREQSEEDRRDRVLFCPPELETATHIFEASGYDPDDCAGCGAVRGEHIDPDEIERLKAEVDRLRGRAERAERVLAVYRQASLIPMWDRWSVRLGRFDPMNAWSTEEAALSALDAALGLDATPADDGERHPDRGG
jgi:hypothetical protein